VEDLYNIPQIRAFSNQKIFDALNTPKTSNVAPQATNKFHNVRSGNGILCLDEEQAKIYDINDQTMPTLDNKMGKTDATQCY
jgi:hypothetical protein